MATDVTESLSEEATRLLKGPSQHLTWAELGCKDGTPYPAAFIRDGRVVMLSVVFEMIRQHCGNQPVAILSAYRSPEHNRKIGGARNSQHVEGRALDLRPPKGWSVVRFHRAIRDVADTIAPEIRGIGLYKTFVHIDVRPSPRLVAWDGGGAKKDSAA